ncbi:MAG: chorismate synthase [Bacteroidales bacterium]|nr:chorismate synthase [Bacteroidales bacterium]
MNSYGTNFRISIFGESHGKLIGVAMDGVPAGISLSEEDFMADLNRRRSGARGTTPRKEGDIPHIVSGTFEGCTTGAPLTVVFENNNTISKDYSLFREIPRPGHADFTAQVKHNFFNDIRGGGHFSGRLTLALVAAGVVAKKILGNIRINAQITAIAGLADPSKWDTAIEEVMAEGDSTGGIIECTCTGVPAGLGEPFFNSLESEIAHLAFSIPGVRGIEFGDGFAAAAMKGSEHNDCFTDIDGHTATNGAGGINGGISNGNPIVFRIAVKPTSSISKVQHTANFITGEIEEFSVKGRHDACIALRCPVIVEAIAAIALAQHIQ